MCDCGSPSSKMTSPGNMTLVIDWEETKVATNFVFLVSFMMWFMNLLIPAITFAKRNNTLNFRAVWDLVHQSCRDIVVILLVAAVVTVVLWLLGPIWEMLKGSAMAVMTGVVISAILHLVGLMDPSDEEVKRYLREKNLDAVDVLAYNFYSRYLCGIINTGEKKRLLERIQEVEDHRLGEEDGAPRGVENPKLFIIIPTSCQVLDSLDESPRIERFQDLEGLLRNVAGIPERVYKNDVYLITFEDGWERLCVAEFATPIRVLMDVIADGHISQTEGEQMAREFYDRLSVYIKDELNTHLVCKPLLYEDPEEAEWDYPLNSHGVLIKV